MSINCKHCNGKGWTWDQGMDTSEDCSWCKGSGELDSDKPTVKSLIEAAAVQSYPKTNFLKALFKKKTGRVEY